MRICFTRRHIPAAIAFAVAIVLALAAFTPSVQKATAQTAASVGIVDFEFQPATTTIEEGGTVTWTNQGAQMHTATGDAGEFDTGQLAPGQSGSATFDTAGTYTYHCEVHPFMTGSIVVTAAGAAPTATTAGAAPAAGAAPTSTTGPSVPATGVGESVGGRNGSVMAAFLGLSGLFLVLGVAAFRRRSA
jgi:plastocyanin